jgi:hypothetical protein
MRVLSFDIGIKNMAYCLMETTQDKKVVIHEWSIMDISKIPKCCLCTKTAKSYVFMTKHKDPTSANYYCSNHTKSYADKHFTKREIKSIEDSDKMDLDYLGQNMYEYLESRPHLWTNIDQILFENQPVFKNPKMKSIQMILYSYFLHKKVVTNTNIGVLKFYSARRKLEIKGINIDVSALDKTEYSDRKKMGKLYAREVLKILGDFANIQKLNEAEKEDDLCDCLIQGLESLQTIGLLDLSVV